MVHGQDGLQSPGEDEVLFGTQWTLEYSRQRQPVGGFPQPWPEVGMACMFGGPLMKISGLLMSICTCSICIGSTSRWWGCVYFTEILLRN